MTTESCGWIVRRIVKECLVFMGVALLLIVAAVHADAQTFSSGSDGSDGPFLASGPAGTVIIFDPGQFNVTQVKATIFNFTTITIQPGVTVKLSVNKISGSVLWL